MRPDGSIEQCGEGVPGGGHSDGDGEGDGREDNRCGPHGGAVDAVNRDEFVDDENENQYAETGVGPSGGRKSDASPGKAADSGGDQAHGGDQDEALVRVWSAPGAPGGVDDDGEADDADQWDGSGDGGVERSDLHPTMKRVDGSHHAEHNHDGRKTEGDGAQGAMPCDAARGDEGGLHGE